MFEKSAFEKAGLKIEKDRVLTYSKLSCPLDCTYCFVEDLNFNQEKGIEYLSAAQYQLLEHLPDEIKIIMLGCDTEFFQHKEKALEILEVLVALRKDLSMITKLPLSPEYIQKLHVLSEKTTAQGNLFTLSVSLPCAHRSPEWEPRVPSPERRIETLKNMYESGLKTFVAIRPLLPTVTKEEMEEIVSQTKDFQNGYYSGPLYLKAPNHPAIQGVSDLKIDELQPDWMPEGNTFFKIEKTGQMEVLREIIEKHGQKLYTGAADAMEHLRNT